MQQLSQTFYTNMQNGKLVFDVRQMKASDMTQVKTEATLVLGRLISTRRVGISCISLEKTLLTVKLNISIDVSFEDKKKYCNFAKGTKLCNK